MPDPTPTDILKSAWKLIPHFKCTDLRATTAFYKDKLGFDCYPDDEANPTMISVAAGTKAAANIYIFRTSGDGFHRSAAMIALGTQQVDEYYRYIQGRGDVEISVGIKDQPWGYRQFEVRDPDGNTVQFFRFLEGGNPGTE